MAETTWRNYLENKHVKPAPLKGIKVLEVCTLILGPAGPSFLAKMGAEVIKCEIPPLGDTSRNLIPFGDYFREQGTGFVHANENKYWMGLDLHKPEGQEIFRQLAARADVVEENMRPGVLEKWNVGYPQLKEINPGLIYISKNGYGQWGQYAEENMPSNDGASQAWSGYAWLSSHPGQRPLKSRLYVCDNYGAAMGEVAVLAALHHRQRTGKGQYIELSQTESIIRIMSWVWPYQQITGQTAMPAGNRDLCVSPADTFRCSDDRFVAIAAGLPGDFRGLCKAMGQPQLAEDPKFRDHLTRLRDENTLEILKIISDWARKKTPEEIERYARHIVLREVGGPIYIGQISGEVARLGLEPFLTFLALFSMNLAVLNLLPIPVLDGGHLLFLAIEGVRRKPLSERVRLRWTQVGFAVLVAIMLLALANDVLRLVR